MPESSPGGGDPQPPPIHAFSCLSPRQRRNPRQAAAILVTHLHEQQKQLEAFFASGDRSQVRGVAGGGVFFASGDRSQVSASASRCSERSRCSGRLRAAIGTPRSGRLSLQRAGPRIPIQRASPGSRFSEAVDATFYDFVLRHVDEAHGWFRFRFIASMQRGTALIF